VIFPGFSQKVNALMMKAAGNSETSVNFYQITRRNTSRRQTSSYLPP
jgi:hypothetical protein